MYIISLAPVQLLCSQWCLRYWVLLNVLLCTCFVYPLIHTYAHDTLCSGSTVWHDCASECVVCTCDCVFVDSPKRQGLLVEISTSATLLRCTGTWRIPIGWLLSSYCVASVAINLWDTVIFRSVQPWPPEPKKGEDTELEQSKWWTEDGLGRGCVMSSLNIYVCRYISLNIRPKTEVYTDNTRACWAGGVISC